MVEKDRFLKEVEELNDNKFTINEVTYENLQNRVKVTCNKCGCEFERKLYSLKYGEAKCPNCSKENRKKRIEQEQENFRLKLIDECKELCENRGYTFIDVFKKQNNYWYIKYDMNRIKPNGEKYAVVEQVISSFKECVPPKETIGELYAISTKEWIEKAKKIHPEYSYEHTKYINNKKSVIITCPKHGDFSVSPKEFLKKDYICAKCKREIAKSERFKCNVEKANEKYGNKYQYDESSYIGVKEKMRIICPEHGEFFVSMYDHLKHGSECLKCKKVHSTKKYESDGFIKRVKKIHGDKYDYSKVEYKGSNEKVCIICPEHGEFWQRACGHLSGMGCPKCGKKEGGIKNSKNRFKTKEQFIEDARKTHGDKYDYSKVDYRGTHEQVCIICHEKDENGIEHGEFWQIAKNHLHGWGCKKCSGTYADKETFANKGNKIHENKYDYSQVVYVSSKQKVDIICPEHGVFKMTPNSHLNGKRGCPYCRESHLERDIRIFLKDHDIEFVQEKRFDWLRNDKTNYTLPIDFYLPKYNIAIECQGEQHFIANFYKSKGDEYADEHLKGVQYRDKRKKDLCKENCVNLIYVVEKRFIPFLQDESNPVFTNLDDMFNYIQSFEKQINTDEWRLCSDLL